MVQSYMSQWLSLFFTLNFWGLACASFFIAGHAEVAGNPTQLLIIFACFCRGIYQKGSMKAFL